MQILAGEFKGRRLLPPRGRGTTRPITGAVKKSLFGMLGEAVENAVVVDLFCGTGTLGLEAVSRGASQCYFAERDRGALQRLRRNIRDVRVDDRCVVWSGDVFDSLAGRLEHAKRPIDIAFVDPPYVQTRNWSWRRAGDRIFAPLRENLSPNGTVVLRADSRAELPETIAGLSTLRLREYGDMVLALLGHGPEGE